MDKLGMLAEFEKRAHGEGLECDEVRLFLLLLAHYDGAEQRGDVDRRTVATALGKGFSSARFKRACCRLSALGLVEIAVLFPGGSAGEDSILVYGLPPLSREQR
jgi:hypothetical protein